ncbi:MAG: sulfatase-like hydrolase/transferase [Planctomycetota bacterium]
MNQPVAVKTRLLLAFGFLSSMILSNPVAAADSERPNVLWIYLEDVSGWFSCYGDTLIETPHIDALAESGVRFDRFYTPAGVCSATRSAIVTGMMQTSIGAHNHRSCRPNFRGKDMGRFDENILDEEVVPAPIRFRDAGYWTFNEGGKDDYNFTFEPDEFYDFVRGRGGWGPGSFLKGDCLKGIGKDQPFFGQIQLGGGKLGNRVKKVIDRSTVPVPPYYPDIPEVREEIGHHYDCLLKTDQQVGQIIQKLRDDGLLNNTLIFMFSDHGYKLHRHKQFLYEGGIHMPLIVSGPGIASGGVREDLISGIDVTAASLAAAGIQVPDNMEGKDFLATEYQPREFLVAARDRCDYTIEKIRAVVTPHYKYLRNYLTDRPFMQASYKDPWDVSKRFREMMAAGEMNETQLVFFGDEKPAEELYDLANDPQEIHNLAGDPAHTAALEQHRQYLKSWIAETGDQGQQRESDIGLLCTLKRWGDKCVAPEYDLVRHMLPNAQAAAGSKPNVLFVFADDQCFDTIQALGNHEVETPNLDRLARSGTTFTHAFNMGSWSGAVCVASRTMLNSGRFLWNANRIHSSSEKEREAGRWWGPMMKQAGYRTYMTGKWYCKAKVELSFDVAKDVRPGMPKAFPEGYNRPIEGQPDPWSPSDPKWGGFWEGGTHWSEVVANHTCDFLEASTEHEEPFFIYSAFNATHDPRQSPQEYLDKYPAERILVPANFQPLHPFADEIGCGTRLRDERLAPFPRTEYAVRVHRREYYALLTHMDAMIGRILDRLDETGKADNTWILFTADHGLAVGQHGLLGKQNQYDHSTRVPFIVVGPGVTPNEINSQKIYLQDAMATALALAGVNTPDHVEFQSLLPVLDGEKSACDEIYGAYLDKQRAIRTDQYKLIHYPGIDEVALFDVQADPLETLDLSERDDMQQTVARLKKRLRMHQVKLGDPMLQQLQARK